MRLYFWFKGAPEYRIGGPWWYRDFETDEKLHGFLSDAFRFLKSYAITEGEELLLAWNIRPPKSATILPGAPETIPETICPRGGTR